MKSVNGVVHCVGWMGRRVWAYVQGAGGVDDGNKKDKGCRIENTGRGIPA